MKERLCLYCNKKFITKYYRWHELNGRKKYCSKKCYIDSQKVDRIKLNCENCNKEIFVIPYRAYKRKNRVRFCSRQCQIKIVLPNGYWFGKKRPKSKMGNAIKTMFKSKDVRGSANKNWKGGITPISKKIRNSLEYKEWRETIFKRDNYTCILCGNNQSGNLNADHIKPFALYPELRFNLSNGRTLCIECHKKTSSYLNNKMTKGGDVYA